MDSVRECTTIVGLTLLAQSGLRHPRSYAVSMVLASDKANEQDCRRTKKKDIYVISTPKRPVPLEHHPTHEANSCVFGTVAESRMMLMCSGNMMMTSSQTTPR
jgi:hypothetical protein